MKKLSTCLWFNGQAEQAAAFYTSVFKNSSLGHTARYQDASTQALGAVMSVHFVVEGQDFVALNGGPQFSFNEAVSVVVNCDTQEELDRLWRMLTDGGEDGRCGWLKDRFGLSWQLVPRALTSMMQDPDQAAAQRALASMLHMNKLNIAALERAFRGG